MLSGLGAYLARAERIIVPESGQGARGPALVPVGQAYEDYRNHPLFTNRMAVFPSALLGQNSRFEFPRLWYTKGETLKAYAETTKRQLLDEAVCTAGGAHVGPSPCICSGSWILSAPNVPRSAKVCRDMPTAQNLRSKRRADF